MTEIESVTVLLSILQLSTKFREEFERKYSIDQLLKALDITIEEPSK